MRDPDTITLKAMTERLQAGPWMALKFPQRAIARAKRVQLAFGPDYPILNISQQAVAEFVHSLQKAYMPSTVNRHLDVLRKLFAEATKLLPDADLPIVGRVYEPLETKVRILTNEEQTRLLTVALNWYGPEWQLFLFVLLDLALRRSEALALVWRDINFNTKTVTIWRTKTNSPRTLPISDRVCRGLKELKLKNPFPVQNKESVFGYSIPQAERKWRKTRKQANLKGIVTHSLRHTAASDLSAGGCPLNVLQAFLGHKNIKSTLRYAHIDTQALALARDVIDNRNTKNHAQKPAKEPVVLQGNFGR